MEYLNDLVDFIVIQAATEIAAKNKRRRLEELKKQQNLQLNKSVGQPGQPGQPGQTVQPIKPVQTIQPGQPGQTIKPVQPVKPVPKFNLLDPNTIVTPELIDLNKDLCEMFYQNIKVFETIKNYSLKIKNSKSTYPEISNLFSLIYDGINSFYIVIKSSCENNILLSFDHVQYLYDSLIKILENIKKLGKN